MKEAKDEVTVFSNKNGGRMNLSSGSPTCPLSKNHVKITEKEVNDGKQNKNIRR